MLACLYSVGLRQLLRVQDVSTQENNLPNFDADKRHEVAIKSFRVNSTGIMHLLIMHLLTEIAEVFNVLAL